MNRPIITHKINEMLVGEDDSGLKKAIFPCIFPFNRDFPETGSQQTATTAIQNSRGQTTINSHRPVKRGLSPITLPVQVEQPNLSPHGVACHFGQVP